MTDPTFAQPLAKLGDSGIGVAAAPSGGMGFALTPNGEIPAGVLFAAGWSGATPLDQIARRMAFGVFTLVFAAAVFTPSTTITHGLGVTPVVVVATGDTNGASSPTVDVGNFTSTTFTARAGDSQGVARTGNQNIFWIAIG